MPDDKVVPQAIPRIECVTHHPGIAFCVSVLVADHSMLVVGRRARVGDRTLLKKSDRMPIQQCSTGHRKAHDSSSHNDNMAHNERAPRMYSINRFSCFNGQASTMLRDG